MKTKDVYKRQARNNAAGNMLSSAVKRLVTESAVLQNRQITIDERGHESIRWTE